MRDALRRVWDRLFTGVSGLSAIVLVLSLVALLGPIAYRGGKAVIFRGTVEFRRMQLEMHGRGDADEIDAELQQVLPLRERIYAILDEFSQGLDIEAASKTVRQLNREYKRQLANRAASGQIAEDEAGKLKDLAKELRDHLLAAYGAADKQVALAELKKVLAHRDDERFKGTVVEQFFPLAQDYQQIVRTVDLSRRQDCADLLAHLRETFGELFGPRPGEPAPLLAQYRYGATRWDRAQLLADRILWRERWLSAGEGKRRTKERLRRAEQFAGTRLEPLFLHLEQNLGKLFRPRMTVYWQYFLDDSTPGHFFGGVGPEMLGTLLLTLLAMAFAFPLGLTAAAYLAEVSADNLLIRIIRTCINTLAGVPSIVFGLFGLSFFVIFLLPALGLPSGSSILAGSLTLAALILPVIIRASEEAIRAVPQTCREASLALGAGRLRTFLTVTLPASLPGVLTGVILSMSRAAGETAPILFTAAVALGPVPRSLMDPTRTLSYSSYDIAVGDRLASQVPHKQYGMVLALVLLVLVLNLTAILIRSRVGKKLRGQ